ncbi:MAG: bifunctional enzyme CysN/CysC [Fusobacteriaceae bacterium]|jgi:bifunctional enzyme CysN/CysC|nr:sulfate adenylyltransferase, large subunit [Fusobacteriales bacterium]MDN5305130.1 bifunctional enzyme CysN/CysC [Fusobacteriaceae bacterium]
MKINKNESMNIVIVGHVDHGKSTIIGRLLADTDSLPEGKLESVKEMCKRNSKPFEYSFLLDALKDEQAQGITIDSARCFFKSNKREYIIIDAPGHIEFLKNMVTGAARAEAALLVIDANEGIQENSKRHGYLLSMLGIKQITILVNKMDLINYDEKIYNQIVKDYTEFLKEINVEPNSFIPVSGFFGDNIVKNSENIPWYNGKSVLETLDEFSNKNELEETFFRMPVQDVYKFTKNGDNRRIVAGTVISGKLKIDDEVIFYPSGKKSVVKTIESFNTEEKREISAGYATGFTLTEQIYISRGELAVKADETAPLISKKIKTNLFWLSKNSLVKNKKYLFKIGTTKVNAEVEDIIRVLDASTLTSIQKKQVDRHDVAELILKLDKPIAFDKAEVFSDTSRFVIVDNYDIAGGGIITESLEKNELLDKVAERNKNWERGVVSREERAEKYNQKPSLILLTGEIGTGRRDIAKQLEKTLLDTGKKAYYLGLENLDFGLDSDIRECDIEKGKQEKLRRFGEITNILLDSGQIVIASIVELQNSEKELLSTLLDDVNIKNFHTIWVGENITTDIDNIDLHISHFDYTEQAVNIIKQYLQDNNIIFRF